MAKAKEKAEKSEGVLNEYNFPDHGLTILAVSIEEAEEKLKELI